MEQLVWTVEIVFREDGDKTRADAVLRGGGDEFHGWGRARRNPDDPELPAVGEELAAARALADLSQHLVDQASHLIEQWEGVPIHLQR